MREISKASLGRETHQVQRGERCMRCWCGRRCPHDTRCSSVENRFAALPLFEAEEPDVGFGAEEGELEGALVARGEGGLGDVGRGGEGIMFAVWRDGTEFDPQLLQPGVVRVVPSAP